MGLSARALLLLQEMQKKAPDNNKVAALNAAELNVLSVVPLMGPMLISPWSFFVP